ncbi:MAG: hypothetical protein D5S03_00605 [Desulfonatronospira sp. MSAO_Bac3]|nr:MAG: hypothetical protein D5S03_00605 [Desulfonatronospira sp. MSAO_Bac3]
MTWFRAFIVFNKIKYLFIKNNCGVPVLKAEKAASSGQKRLPTEYTEFHGRCVASKLFKNFLAFPCLPRVFFFNTLGCSVGKTSWLSLKMKQHVGLKFVQRA